MAAAERRYLDDDAAPGSRRRLLWLLSDLYSGELAERFPARGLIVAHWRGDGLNSLPRASPGCIWRGEEAEAELPAVLWALCNVDAEGGRGSSYKVTFRRVTEGWLMTD